MYKGFGGSGGRFGVWGVFWGLFYDMRRFFGHVCVLWPVLPQFVHVLCETEQTEVTKSRFLLAMR